MPESSRRDFRRSSLESFLKAVRGRDPKELEADLDDAHLSSALTHVANIARGGEEANRLLTRDCRAPAPGWRLLL